MITTPALKGRPNPESSQISLILVPFMTDPLATLAQRGTRCSVWTVQENGENIMRKLDVENHRAASGFVLRALVEG